MNLIEQINLLFDDFQSEMCRAWDGYNSYWRPNWKNEVETELNLIREHSPILLPEDYCEIFRHFGGGGIDDTRPNKVIPTMTFWTCLDIPMIMKMAGIAVGRHYHLKAVAPQLLGQLDADLMGGFRCDLISLKRLIAVVAHPAPQFAP